MTTKADNSETRPVMLTDADRALELVRQIAYMLTEEECEIIASSLRSYVLDQRTNARFADSSEEASAFLSNARCALALANKFEEARNG